MKVPAFVRPSEIASLAEDMSEEFGGSEKGWRRDIRDPYVYKFNYGGRNQGGNNRGGNGGNNDGHNPVVIPNVNQPGVNPGGFNPNRPQNAQMPAQLPMPTQDLQRRAMSNMEMSPALNTAYMQQRMQSQMPSSPFGFGSNQMQAQTPGLLASMMPQQSQMQQQSQPRGLLSNDIPPEVMQLIMRTQSRT